jgi:hypothetical protein
MIRKQFGILLIVAIFSFQTTTCWAKENVPSGLVDDSLRDITVVLGTGVAGAILGLSTLSFVDEPSKHLKNIAVGGAIGIVVGVAAVVFYQASKTTISEVKSTYPLSEEQFVNVTKQEFIQMPQEKVTANGTNALRILLPF